MGCFSPLLLVLEGQIPFGVSFFCTVKKFACMLMAREGMEISNSPSLTRMDCSINGLELMRTSNRYSWPLIKVWSTFLETNLDVHLILSLVDVVPVENTTWDSWTHPPYDGYYDGQLVLSNSLIDTDQRAGKKIWGRGSSDDKSQLISIL
jgi:hypothetical protein